MEPKREGDVVQSFFFSPKEPAAGFIWGVGPVLLLPASTDDRLGTDEWAAGPTGVVLRQDGPWTWGALVNHLWSYAGPGGQPVNATFLQPFLSYNTKTATTFTLNSESTYDWKRCQWSIPINLQVSQLVKLGSQRARIGFGGRYWAETPRGGPDWVCVSTSSCSFRDDASPGVGSRLAPREKARVSEGRACRPQPSTRSSRFNAKLWQAAACPPSS